MEVDTSCQPGLAAPATKEEKEALAAVWEQAAAAEARSKEEPTAGLPGVAAKAEESALPAPPAGGDTESEGSPAGAAPKRSEEKLSLPKVELVVQWNVTDASGSTAAAGRSGSAWECSDTSPQYDR